jgi:hypothetical protein
MYVSLHLKDVPRHLFNAWREKNERLAPQKQVSKVVITLVKKIWGRGLVESSSEIESSQGIVCVGYE